MFGSKKTITDRVRDVLTEYIDKKFEDYRGQIAIDLARGLAALAGLIAIWTLAIVCLMFVSIAFALLLGWLLSFWMNSFAFVLSFLIVAVVLLGTAFFVLMNKEKYIEDPVFKIMSETLRSPETWGLEDKSKKSETKKSDSRKQEPVVKKQSLEITPEQEDYDEEEEDMLGTD